MKKTLKKYKDVIIGNQCQERIKEADPVLWDSLTNGNTVENAAATETEKTILKQLMPSRKSERKIIMFLYQESCIMLMVPISQ